jgi:hypothetical protein
VGGRQSCCFFVKKKKNPWWKGSVRRCVVMMKQSVLLSLKFEAMFPHIFKQPLWNVTVVWRTGCLGCQDEFFVSNPLDVNEHAFDSVLHLSRNFRSQWVRTFRVLLKFSSPECLSNHCQCPSRTSEICTKFDAVPLSDPSQNCIRSDTWPQIKGRKNQHVHPPWLPRYTSTIIYSCIIASRYNCRTDGSTCLGNYGS